MPIISSPRPKATIAELRREFAQAHPDERLSRAVTAAGMGYSQSWLELVATKGGGPPYFKCGRRVLYKKADTVAWIREHAQRVRSTSDYLPDALTSADASPVDGS